MSNVVPAGFRLHRLEVLNWGTFHQQVWRMEPAGFNSLLTGDIGSGKSTLVDALTTLLVPRPSNQIVFNKAAGSETQERTIASYVRGQYKKDVDHESQRAKAVVLRDETSYSVLLATFRNGATGQAVCLAQVFWFRERGGQPERMYLIAERDLTIRDAFRGFDDITQLRQKLRRGEGIKICDGMKDYAHTFRRLMGISTDKALDLLYQTVSMKSVSNLTDFVREHMLDGNDAPERVRQLCHGFEDLDRAYAAVVKARTQIGLLKPIVEDGLQHEQLGAQVKGLRQSRDCLESWRASRTLDLVAAKLEALATDGEKLSRKLAAAREQETALCAKEDGLRQAIAASGGGRLTEIGRELTRLAAEHRRRVADRERYAKWAAVLDLPAPRTIDQFVEQQKDLVRLQEETRARDAESDNLRTEHLVALRTVKEAGEALAREIDAITGRPSNVPGPLLALRRRLCEELGLEESRLPFAGELIQVRPEERAWEGATERVLHNFALSLIVEDQLYQAVSDWVDRTHLKGRLVYYRAVAQRRPADLAGLDEASLVHKLALKEESPAYGWLLAQLVERFDYRCTDDLGEFRRHPRALTRQGQMKGSGERHEKDDRHSITDRSRYVLGWSNKAKLAALRDRLAGLRRDEEAVSKALAGVQRERNAARERSECLLSLLLAQSFDVIDPDSVVKVLKDLRDEAEAIEQRSSGLKELQGRLAEAGRELAQARQKINDLQESLHACRADMRSKGELRAECEETVASLSAAEREAHFPRIDAVYAELYPDPPTLPTLRSREAALRERLKNDIDAVDKRVARLRDAMIRGMQSYRAAYPSETHDVDASPDALGDFQRMLQIIQDDGLPAFEARFKQELNEKTIQSVVHFQSLLEKERREICDRIEQINQSLATIDYNEGTCIKLIAQPVTDKDIREFQQQLRGCLEGTLGEDLYDERRFLKVKSVIERFQGREGSAEADRRWTERVTDVRNWYEFAATELWRLDGTIKEYYEGTSGKSGGQKEKLAYTVLASALAYQFDLHQQERRLRAFRFVMIDEAFGKGSDESTRYGLELFGRLGLQLLIVTPLQKLRVIEDYVRGVHFVHNEGGKNSQLRNMTIEEYRTLREERDQRALVAARGLPSASAAEAT